MKSNILKLFVLLVSTITIFTLTGCGGNGANGTSSQTNLVTDPAIDLGGAPLVGVPYTTTVHVTNSTTLDSHTVAPTNGETHTHTWVQTSGPTATLTHAGSVATITPSATGTVGILHTVTNTATGLSTHTNHTVQVVAHPPSMQIHTSYATSVPGGLPASLNVDVAGGTAPYTYVWIQPTGTPLTLDFSKNGPAHPVVTLPVVHTDELIDFKVTVTDAAGTTRRVDIRFTILAIIPLDAAIKSNGVTYSSQGTFQDTILECNPSGGVVPYTYLWEFVPTTGITVSFSPNKNSQTVVIRSTNNVSGNPLFACSIVDATGTRKSVSYQVAKP